MAIYLCHEHPELYRFDTEVVATRPGAVALGRSAFHPGGGGQVSDRGHITRSAGSTETWSITGIEVEGDTWWHLIEPPDPEQPDVEVALGPVAATVDAEHRHRVASLHTTSHVLNALVFAEFSGALVTGAQINGDGTGRMDFDLPDVDNDRLRALADPVNEVIEHGRAVRSVYVDLTGTEAADGLIRSLSVAPPPTPDGRLRVIEIEGLDRQACGGTHLDNTAASPPIRITKIENKGRRNRRIRFAFA